MIHVRSLLGPGFVVLLVSCSRVTEPAPTADPAPTAELAPPVDPCAGAELTPALTAARAALEANEVDTYEHHADSITNSIECADERDAALELSGADVIAGMGADMISRGDAQAGRVLLLRARRTYAAVAEHTQDEALAQHVAELQLELAERVLEPLTAYDDPPRSKRCKTNAEGMCVYSTKRVPEQIQPKPYDDDSRERLEAYAIYEAHVAPSEALRELRYRHIHLHMDHDDFAGAAPLLERYVVDYDGHLSAVWAAHMLLDALMIPWLTRKDVQPTAELLVWLDRLPTLELWQQRPQADTLRESIPTLRAGAMWQLAMHARDEAHVAWTSDPPQPSDGFRRCADIFVEIFNAFENHERAATLLWNAADCSLANNDVGQALSLYGRLLERFPDSEHARDTLASLADLEQALFMIERAATHALQLVRRYPKHERASEMLERAYENERALGRDGDEIVELYVKLFARKRPDQVARMLWRHRPSAPGERLVHAKDFYSSTLARSWPDGQLDAARTITELSWAGACRDRLDPLGLCVSRGEPRPSSACTLGPGSLPRVRPRVGKRVDEAVQHARALSKLLVSRYQYAVDDVPITIKATAAAEFYQLEPVLEALMIAGPNATDVASQAKQLDDGYRSVAAHGDPEYAVRAHGRRALVWEMIANAGLTRRDGICEPTRADTKAAIEHATQAHEACVQVAIETQWFDAHAHRCEAALASIAPHVHSTVVEFVGEPKVSGPSITSAGVSPESVLGLDTSAPVPTAEKSAPLRP
jgi:hypothetical protein